MNAAEKEVEKARGKMGGGIRKSGSRSWQSQGVSNPCLRRERRAAHLMMSVGYVISGAIRVKSWKNVVEFDQKGGPLGALEFLHDFAYTSMAGVGVVIL
jgi:hypothetical protein